MLARLRSWWQKTSKMQDAVVILMLAVLIALVAVIVLGYKNNWPWTGLRGKTLYDWLQLLIIPAVLAGGGYLFNYTTSRNERQANAQRVQTERESAEKQAQTERDVASDNQREQALQAYIDSMSELLLHEKLRESGDDDEVRTIARVRTITLLFQLDARRIGYVFAFLREAGLMSEKPNESVVSFNQAILTRLNLRQAYLWKANLSGAYLYEADLSGAYLREANLSEANLSEADLGEADLGEADLRGSPRRRPFQCGC